MAVGAVLVVCGVALLAVSANPAGNGWFSFSAVSDGSTIHFGNGVVLLTRAQQAALGLVVAGLVTAAGGLGYRLGRSRRG